MGRNIKITALADFGRTLRDEPAYGVYKHKIYVTKDNVLASEVQAWLKKTYAEHRKGYLYRVANYLHTDGNRYVDYIFLQTCTDADLVEIQLRWGYSLHKVQRGERVPRRKLTKDQCKVRDAIVAQALAEFYKSLG